MIELFFKLLMLTIFVGLLGFALWFGAALIIVLLISSFFLAIFIFLRSYWLSWKYRNAPQAEKPTPKVETTIIDVEYKDL